MNTEFRKNASDILSSLLPALSPADAVRNALGDMTFDDGRIRLVAVGKAAYTMALAAAETLGDRIDGGIVITKYGHAKKEIPGLTVGEAGHPVPDENSFLLTEKALKLTEALTERDTVLVLLSGGGSALFEKPLVEPEELQEITDGLLRSGADIREINTVRRHLSAVKGGKFALHCAPAKVVTVALSDVIGDDPATVASGPTVPDPTTAKDALAVLEKYGISLRGKAYEVLNAEEPPVCFPVGDYRVIGNTRLLCEKTADACRALGYAPIVITDGQTGEASEVGRKIASLPENLPAFTEPTALIFGGETTVTVRGRGLGGRNQELALAAAETLAGKSGYALFSFGSDGTDGPTDAAGGYADGDTFDDLKKRGLDCRKVLSDNDAYHALEKVGGLLVTGPTGTNLCDVTVLLIKPEGTVLTPRSPIDDPSAAAGIREKAPSGLSSEWLPAGVLCLLLVAMMAMSFFSAMKKNKEAQNPPRNEPEVSAAETAE